MKLDKLATAADRSPPSFVNQSVITWLLKLLSVMEIDGTDSANRRNFLKSLTLRDLASNKKEVIFVRLNYFVFQLRFQTFLVKVR